MTTAVILAGGQSSRMGQDKAIMFGGVARIHTECMAASITKIITLCGAKERRFDFPGEVWPDPEDCNNLVEILHWAFAKIDGGILLIPCDAFSLTASGIAEINNMADCVPVDERGIRQPLHAKIVNRELLDWQGKSINELFASYPSFRSERFGSEFTNYNTPKDLKNPRLQ